MREKGVREMDGRLEIRWLEKEGNARRGKERKRERRNREGSQCERGLRVLRVIEENEGRERVKRCVNGTIKEKEGRHWEKLVVCHDNTRFSLS